MLTSANPESIIITGGKPLCCLEFKEIIGFVKKKYSGKLGLQTNGTLINVDNGKFIAENFDGVDISLDGYDKKSCEKIRGKGVFELVLRGIEILKSFNMKKISLSMTITSYTYNNEKKFMELCKAWGVKSVIRRFAPVGRGIKSQEEFFDIQHIINRKIPYYNPSGICSSAEFGFTSTVCGALKYRFYVGADAYIYPCGASCMKEFRIENIDKIEDINWFFKSEKYRLYDGFKKFVSIFPENLSECSQCSVYLFCVGYPLSLYMYKKIGVLEEYCNIGNCETSSKS